MSELIKKKNLPNQEDNNNNNNKEKEEEEETTMDTANNTNINSKVSSSSTTTIETPSTDLSSSLKLNDSFHNKNSHDDDDDDEDEQHENNNDDNEKKDKEDSNNKNLSSSTSSSSYERLHKFENKRRLYYNNQLTKYKNEWTVSCNMLNVGLEEIIRFERIVAANIIINQQYSDALEAIYDDVYLDDNGNVVSTESLTGAWKQNQLQNKRMIKENYMSILNSHESTSNSNTSNKSKNDSRSPLSRSSPSSPSSPWRRQQRLSPKQQQQQNLNGSMSAPTTTKREFTFDDNNNKTINEDELTIPDLGITSTTTTPTTNTTTGSSSSSSSNNNRIRSNSSDLTTHSSCGIFLSYLIDTQDSLSNQFKENSNYVKTDIQSEIQTFINNYKNQIKNNINISYGNELIDTLQLIEDKICTLWDTYVISIKKKHGENIINSIKDDFHTITSTTTASSSSTTNNDSSFDDDDNDENENNKQYSSPLRRKMMAAVSSKTIMTKMKSKIATTISSKSPIRSGSGMIKKNKEQQHKVLMDIGDPFIIEINYRNIVSYQKDVWNDIIKKINTKINDIITLESSRRQQLPSLLLGFIPRQLPSVISLKNDCFDEDELSASKEIDYKDIENNINVTIRKQLKVNQKASTQNRSSILNRSRRKLSLNNNDAMSITGGWVENNNGDNNQQQQQFLLPHPSLDSKLTNNDMYISSILSLERNVKTLASTIAGLSGYGDIINTNYWHKCIGIVTINQFIHFFDVTTTTTTTTNDDDDETIRINNIFDTLRPSIDDRMPSLQSIDTYESSSTTPTTTPTASSSPTKNSQASSSAGLLKNLIPIESLYIPNCTVIITVTNNNDNNNDNKSNKTRKEEEKEEEENDNNTAQEDVNTVGKSSSINTRSNRFITFEIITKQDTPPTNELGGTTTAEAGGATMSPTNGNTATTSSNTSPSRKMMLLGKGRLQRKKILLRTQVQQYDNDNNNNGDNEEDLLKEVDNIKEVIWIKSIFSSTRTNILSTTTTTTTTTNNNNNNNNMIGPPDIKKSYTR